jgi:hypothetical protein
MNRNAVDIAHKILTHNWVILSVGCLLGVVMIICSK